MAKKIQLQIPTPCHENWDKMNPVEKGRFCGSCQKQVIDFSRMTDREIAIFFKKKSTGSVCGRFADDQLNCDMEIPKKRIPWFKYFFQFVLPAFIFSYKAKSQGNLLVLRKDTVAVPANCSNIKGEVKPVVMGKMVSTPIVSEVIRGRVINETGDPVPFASVMVKGMKLGVVADANGLFSFPAGQVKNNSRLVASCVGFEVLELSLANRNLDGEIVMQLTKVANEELLGAVVVTCSPNYKKGLVLGSISKIESKAIITEPVTTPSMIKLFPNPIVSGSSLNIQWDLKEIGDHTMQLFNVSGQIIFTKNINIDNETKLLNIDLPSLTAGTYFVKITGKKASHTEKLIVQ